VKQLSEPRSYYLTQQGEVIKGYEKYYIGGVNVTDLVDEIVVKLIGNNDIKIIGMKNGERVKLHTDDLKIVDIEFEVSVIDRKEYHIYYKIETANIPMC